MVSEVRSLDSRGDEGGTGLSSREDFQTGLPTREDWRVLAWSTKGLTLPDGTLSAKKIDRGTSLKWNSHVDWLGQARGLVW